jgi:hypothetical protein
MQGEKDAQMKDPCTIKGCICKLPGANPRVHGQPAKDCAECGGRTGLHRLSCSRLLTEAPLVRGYDIDEETWAKLVKPALP